MSPTFWKIAAIGAAVLIPPALAAAPGMKRIGEVAALIAEASTADEAAELADGRSGDTAFPFISAIKPLATVGEVDAVTGQPLTGPPDGHAAWLADEATVRVAYQSESTGPMSRETYVWPMTSGATFTGSHIHWIDYDRAGLDGFLDTDAAAATIVKGSGHLFDRVFNVFGNEVTPKAEGGVWGNQALPDGTLVEFAPELQPIEADFYFHSFCAASYEKAGKYGDGIGFADDVWLASEESNIQRMFREPGFWGFATGAGIDTDETMGLASLVVDIRTATAYTAPALGQTGYEKMLPINPGHPDYVVLALAGYNYGVEPAPLKIYIGRKGLDAAGNPVGEEAPERDRFLARNGLLNGRIYGLAVANADYPALGIERPDPSASMMDAYIADPDPAERFAAAFLPTSYRWGGWDSPVAVGETEMRLWRKPEEQPEGFTYFVGDSKVEQAAADPDITRHRWAQNLTHAGGIVAIELTDLAAELEAAGGGLPERISARVDRVLGAYEGALTLEVAGKGIKHGGAGTQATWENGSARVVAADGLQWIKASDADVLIVDEDSGNDYGERKYALVIDPQTMQLAEEGRGYFLAMAGGKLNPRARVGASAFGGTFQTARSSEFSSSWVVTALLARKDDGSFYTMEDLAGPAEQAINASVPLSGQVLIGVVQHRTESAGEVAAEAAGLGGQIFVYSLALPQTALAARQR